MRARAADLAIAGVLTAVGVAMAVQSASYQVFAADGGIGPGFMPFVAGLALAAFSAWVGAQTLVRGRRAGHATGGEPDAPVETSRPSTAERRVALVFGLALGAIVLAYVTGFLVAFGLLVFVLLAVVEREAVWLSGVITVVAVTFCYFVFVAALRVPLPGGMFGLLGTP